LDSDQRAAVGHVAAGPVRVLAAPGSGKTRLIVARALTLLEQGFAPAEILCVTFSVAAAVEMRVRLGQLLGRPPDSFRQSVSTFHSQAFQLLRREKIILNEGAVVRGRRVLKILKEIVGEHVALAARAYIERQRRTLQTPQEALSQIPLHSDIAVLARAYEIYDRYLADSGLVDFDSMVYGAVKLLEKNIQLLERLQRLFKHVLVDEAHDTSNDQCRMAELLAAPENNLFIVGDQNQSIYGWRGATGKILNHRSGVCSYFLRTNYRSGTAIIGTFQALADSVQGSPMEIHAARSFVGTVQLTGHVQQDLEVQSVCQHIKGSPFEFREIAILARTHAVLASYAETLTAMHLPYNWTGQGFWQRAEIQDALAFLRLLSDPNDDEALRRALIVPLKITRGLGQKFCDYVTLAAREQKCSLLEVENVSAVADYKNKRWRDFCAMFFEIHLSARFWTVQETLRTLLSEAGFWQDSDRDETDNFVTENLLELLNRASLFSSLQEFILHASYLALSPTQKGITLSTIHGAKGREWKQVFVVAVCSGVLPHCRATDQEEERRILYVALSRAQDSLHISWHGEASPLLERLRGKALMGTR
jgi:Superfamily I DNA and RNA helicases